MHGTLCDKKILLIMHQAGSDPGRVGLALRTMGYDLDMRVPAIGDPLPDDLSRYAGIVIFGGPMSANDDHEEFVRKELDYIPTILKSEKPYLGICLGAQLMARALGAKVATHEEGYFEIGYFEIQPTETTQQFIPKNFNVYQWHGEGFDLPTDAKLLASGDKFPNQAYRIGEKAFGIQFHPEVTEAMNRRWVTKAAHRLVEPGAQAAEIQLRNRKKFDPFVSFWLDEFLTDWLKSD
jgi:GMP synthase (glutamine-hydrolysing)